MRILCVAFWAILVYSTACAAADAEVMVIRPGSTEWKTPVSPKTSLWQSTSEPGSVVFKPVFALFDRMLRLVEKIPAIKPLEPRAAWNLKGKAMSYGVKLHATENLNIRIATGYAFGHTLFEQKKAFKEYRYRAWDGPGLFFGLSAIFRF